MEKENGYRSLISIDKCARCGYSEMKSSLHVHHIDYNHKNNSLDNLIVLCANCHYGLHRNDWNISEIGIKDVQKKCTKSTSRFNKGFYEYKVNSLKDEISYLQNNIIEFEGKISYYKNIEHIQTKKNIALFSLLNQVDYNLRDFVVFLMNKIPDDWFKDIESEFGKNTKNVMLNVNKVFDEYKHIWKKSNLTVLPISNDIDEFSETHYNAPSMEEMKDIANDKPLF